jgi:hypothetical protein
MAAWLARLADSSQAERVTDGDAEPTETPEGGLDMRSRSLLAIMAAVVMAMTLVPAAGAIEGTSSPSVTGTLTYLTKPTDTGTVRGVFADMSLHDFTAGDIDDSAPGGIVVRLRDAAGQTLSQVSLRPGAFSGEPGVPDGTTDLTAPIDSVWGTFDYAADGYWTQPRNLRINGGNCEGIVDAEVTIQLNDGFVHDEVTATLGPPQGSCSDIRR